MLSGSRSSRSHSRSNSIRTRIETWTVGSCRILFVIVTLVVIPLEQGLKLSGRTSTLLKTLPHSRSNSIRTRIETALQGDFRLPGRNSRSNSIRTRIETDWRDGKATPAGGYSRSNSIRTRIETAYVASSIGSGRSTLVVIPLEQGLKHRVLAPQPCPQNHHSRSNSIRTRIETAVCGSCSCWLFFSYSRSNSIRTRIETPDRPPCRWGQVRTLVVIPLEQGLKHKCLVNPEPWYCTLVVIPLEQGLKQRDRRLSRCGAKLS